MHFQLNGHFSGNGRGYGQQGEEPGGTGRFDKGIESDHDSPPNALICTPTKDCRTNVYHYAMQAV
jgi:hypothetical protein